MEQRRIAIIDDDPVTIETIKICLSNDLASEAAIHTYVSGREFLKNMTLHDYHLVVSDLEMPDVSGMEIIKEVKSYKRSTPVIVLTGNSQLIRSHLEIQSFIFEILIKPVEYKHLLRAVKDGLACSDFYNPPASDSSSGSLDGSSLDDRGSAQRLKQELIDLHLQLKKLIFQTSIDRVQAAHLLDSQYRLLHVLFEKENH